MMRVFWKPITKRIFFFLAIFVLLLAGCDLFGKNSTVKEKRTYEDSVKKVIFTENKATVTFENLNRHNIYLLKINTSNVAVPAANTGRTSTSYPELEFYEEPVMPDEPDSIGRFRHINYKTFHDFNANLPPINREKMPKDRSLMEGPVFIPAKVGDKKSFWVERPTDSDKWEQAQATLMAAGNHGNIWVMDDNEVQLKGDQAKKLSDKFDLIYPLAANILGYEYGGGPEGNGGVDGDPKIQILVYDILDDSGDNAASGFFWSKDHYQQTQLDEWNWKIKTNEAEIFYIDADTVINYADFAYSALVHELQHMINFNVKYVENDENSGAWYNEMLSMMAEDIISPLIGVTHLNYCHPILQRMPRFLGRYNQNGFTEWGFSDDILDSYSSGYAFGAYLLRNFGGADLLKKILANNTTNIDSITAALQENGLGTFEQALLRFAEAMIFSGSLCPDDALTFDRTAENTINDTVYTANKFNIWNINRYPGYGIGPYYFPLSQQDMRPHSVLVHSSSAWQNKNGRFSITLEKPANPAIELYLMLR